MAVYFTQDITFATNEVLAEMNKIISSASDTFLKRESEKSLLKADIQICVDHKFKNELKASIHKVLMDYCFYAERLSPGGFKKTLMNVTSLSKGVDIIDSNIQVFHPNINDLETVINNSIKEQSMSKLVIEAIRLAGFGGKISIEKSVNSLTSIELIEGYVFKHNQSNLKSIKLIKPKVICIDGYIESVSEINMLFEGVVETKQQLLLISRGMHDDVINTIKVNRDRGTMMIYPIIIDFDLDGINTISDISTIVNNNPVSCHFGELISSIKVSDAFEIDEAMIVGNSLTLKNSKTRSNVNIHIRNLVKKRQSSNIDIESLITTRIKSLMCNNVIVRLPDDANYTLKSLAIDQTIRSIKSMMDYGIIDYGEKIELAATNNSSNEISKKCFKQIKNLDVIICN